MTENTQQLIIKFAKTLDVSVIPSIIIGMQEEDDLSATIKYKNCIRALRNIAAHEPNVIVSQITAPVNMGSCKIVFVPKSESMDDRVSVDFAQFTAWMFDVADSTDNMYYIVFWEAMARVLYKGIYGTKVAERMSFNIGTDKDALIRKVSEVQSFLWSKRGKLKCFQSDDPYMNKLYLTNTCIFWRVVVPNLMDIVSLFIDGTFDDRNKGNRLAYIKLFEEREGANVLSGKE